MDQAQYLNTRLLSLNQQPPASDGRYVLYWMQQQRRLHYNFAVQHACYRAAQHQCPLLIIETLDCNYAWASDRHHSFAIAGMCDHRQACKGLQVGYFPFIEEKPGDMAQLMQALAEASCEVVTDDVPCFFVDGNNQLAADWPVRATAVDSNGILPMRLLEKPCPTAAVFRRHLHKHAAAALSVFPAANPLTERPLTRWRDTLLPPLPQRLGASHTFLKAWLASPTQSLTKLPIDHSVAIVPGRGGRRAALRECEHFIAEKLSRYGAERSDPVADSASGLSPYLHWGHISSHEILQQVWEHEADWDIGRLPEKGGARLGFWPLSESAQRYIDELLTWRELGYHTATLRPDAYGSYHGLPDWARLTLAQHSDDPRPYTYTLDEFTRAQTHDEVWNAAMRQLLREGIIHNYLRMLWGKKILEWSPGPEIAFEWALILNNKWSLDGNNPNSFSGVSWCFGRYDRPWFERDIFGKIRYMSSDSTRRKFPLSSYLERYKSLE